MEHPQKQVSWLLGNKAVEENRRQEAAGCAHLVEKLQLRAGATSSTEPQRMLQGCRGWHWDPLLDRA